MAYSVPVRNDFIKPMETIMNRVCSREGLIIIFSFEGKGKKKKTSHQKVQTGMTGGAIFPANGSN